MNFWTDKEKIEVYKLYIELGNDWKTIASKIKKKTTSEAVRKMFNRTKWEKIIEKNNIKIDKNKIKKKIEKNTEKNTEKKYRDPDILIKERQTKLEEKHETRKLNEYLDNIAKENLILEKITSAINSVEKINFKNIEINKDEIEKQISPQEAVLLLSDMHYGLAVLEEETGGIGYYTKEVYNKRLNNLVNTALKITNLHRKNHKLDTLHICFLGDIVHGCNDSGKWGFLHMEQNVADQVFGIIPTIIESILKLKSFYKNIKIYCVYGNHGRVGKRGVEKKFVNFDYMIYQTLKGYLKNQKDIDFVIPKSPFCIAQVMNKKLLLTHGSEVRSWQGIPWYGLTRTEQKYKSLIERTKTENKIINELNNDDFKDMTKEEIIRYTMQYMKTFDYLITGHFHTLGEVETTSGGRIILNSCFAGGDDYSITDLISASTPAQKFFGVNRDGKTWSYDIELDRN